MLRLRDLIHKAKVDGRPQVCVHFRLRAKCFNIAVGKTETNIG